MQILSASLQSFVSAGLYCCEKRRCRFYLLAKVLFQQVFNCCVKKRCRFHLLALKVLFQQVFNCIVKRRCRFYLLDPATPMDIAPSPGYLGPTI